MPLYVLSADPVVSDGAGPGRGGKDGNWWVRALRRAGLGGAWRNAANPNPNQNQNQNPSPSPSPSPSPNPNPNSYLLTAKVRGAAAARRPS